MTESDVAALSAALGRPIDAVVRQPGRTRSMVFRATTPDGDLALKVYPSEYTITELRSEVQLAEVLHRAGVPVPRYRHAGSEVFIPLSDGSRVAVYEWVPGSRPDALNRDFVVKGAELLYAFHEATRHIPIIRDDRWLWADAVRYTAQRIGFPKALETWIRDTVRTGRPWPDTAAMVACHNDLMPENVVVTPCGGLTAIDLTNVILAPPAWDIAVYCAGLLLAPEGLALDAQVVLDLVISSYNRAGGEVEYDDFLRLLEIALAQRSVFLTEGVDPERGRAVWERLTVALRTVAPRAGVGAAQ